MTDTIPTPSQLIDQAKNQLQAILRNSSLGHQEALDELWEVWNDCRKTDWDGHGALPVDQETYRAAYLLIESLPLGFPKPSLGAEPDGHLTLEWYKSPCRILSVSVDPEGVLHYAGLYGSDKRYGSLTFFSTAPYELIQLVRDL